MDNGSMPSGVVTEEQFDRSFASPSTGLTKREYISTKILSGLLSNSSMENVDLGVSYPTNNANFALCAIAITDALLKELSK